MASQLCSHESCVLAALRGLSQGVTYGAKVRFTHSIVMAILFSKEPWSRRVQNILKNAYSHGKLLGTYVFLYKSLQCILTRARGGKQPVNSLIAGGVAGYFVFSRETPITSQITLYLLSRVVTAGTALMYKKGLLPQTRMAEYSFSVLTTLCWALVMYLFESNREVLQQSLTRSMNYLYDGSDSWKGKFDFVPFGDSLQKFIGRSV